ncbi:MAG: hypothetical protein KKF44_07205 [Nanoarchaeota archaeon]|nr:hypothetical protein [Nanoarchaeota archaeon]
MAIELDEVKKIFEEIDILLTQKTRCYVFGGAVLLYHKLKGATKDIDLVVKTKAEYLVFTNALEKLGFKVNKLEGTYLKLKLNGIYQKDNYRFDVFNDEICDMMKLSEGMIERAQIWYKFNHLEIYRLSTEDIFLLKSLTERDGDVVDSNAIIDFGVDWDIILEEIKKQIEAKNMPVWITDFAARLDVLEEKYQKVSPIKKIVDSMVEDYYDYLELMQHLDEPKTFEELQKETQIRELKKVIFRHLKSGDIKMEKDKYISK